jgi:hypothetical protein
MTTPASKPPKTQTSPKQKNSKSELIMNSEDVFTAEEPKSRKALDTILKHIPGNTNSATTTCSNHLRKELKFVNRDEVVIKIGACHLRNLFHLSRGTTDTRRYRYGIFIDQINGSGKTTTVVKLLEKLQELKVNLLNYIVDRGLDTILQFVEANIDTWLSASYVKITGDQEISALSVDSMAMKIAWLVGADATGRIDTILHHIKDKKRAILVHVDDVTDDFSRMKMILTNCVTLEEQAANHGIMLQYIITGRNTQILRVSIFL